MKVKTLFLLAAALLMTALVANANTMQFCVQLTQRVLTVSCTSPDPIPANNEPYTADGGMVWIYRDWEMNGPNVPCTNAAWWQDTYTPGGIIQLTTSSVGDTLLNMYTGSCVTSVRRKFPYNNFPMDNLASGMPLGQFICPYNDLSCNNYPTTSPNQFFCVVTYKDANNNKVVWVSGTFTVASDNGSHVVELGEWCCVYKAGTVPCVPPPDTYFTPNRPSGQETPVQGACVTICKDHPQMVCVGPVLAADRVPHVHVAAGCDNAPLCLETCTPAVGFIWNEAAPWAWTVNPVGHPAGNYYCKTITWDGLPGDANGCVCITFDFIEPVGMGEVSILPLDNSVKFTWNTLSETNLDKWIVKRDNVAIYEENAHNGSSGHSYSYTDASAINGTTYSYALVARHSDGSEEIVRTLSATPSLDNAVVTEYALRQNYPNPFNPTTKIMYDVLNTNLVTLKIYNAAGQEVTTLVNETKAGGKRYSVNFDATNLPSGLYFYNIRIGSDFSATKKMLLVK
jgi:hypothetical protein